MSTEEKGETTQYEVANGAPRRTFGQKIVHHYKRFWWVHLIILIIVVLVVTLPVVYVGYPKIAQDAINHSGLNVTTFSSSNPSPNRITIDFVSGLFTHSKYHPILRSFHANISLTKDKDHPLFSIVSPEVKKVEMGAIQHVHDDVEILSPDQFTQFSTDLLLNDTVVVYLQGKGDVKESKLPTTDVNYNVPSTLGGLGGLTSITVVDLVLHIFDAFPNGTNAVGNVFINNPSNATLQMGDVKQTHFVAGTRIANSTIPDLTLRPGNVSYPIYFTNELIAVNGLLGQTRYQCGFLPVDIKTNSSSFNGEVIPYYTEALQAAPLKTLLNLGPALRGANLGNLIKGPCSS